MPPSHGASERAGRVRWLLGLAVAPTLVAGVAASSLDTYNLRVGTQTFSGLYQFTTNSLLVETAEAIQGMGSDIIKFALGRGFARQYGVKLPAHVTNLVQLARDEPSCRRVLDAPFRHYVLWAYCFGPGGDAYWVDGMSEAERRREYEEFQALAVWLLTQYRGSGKRFLLGHWEGDWYLLPQYRTTVNPSAVAIQGMRDWLNTRQRAVDDARRVTPHTNVSVFVYAEVNRVRDALTGPPTANQRAINTVVPAVPDLDYVSWSSYDGQDLPRAELIRTLDYIESLLPTNKSGQIPGRRVFVGEFGWGGRFGSAEQVPRTRVYLQHLLEWGVPYALFWQIYNNEPGRSYGLIDSTGRRTECYELLRDYLAGARRRLEGFERTRGRLPTEAEFGPWVAPLLEPTPPAGR